MPRIRSIKPGFCTDEDIAKLSIPCRLHFAMLWTYADDEGRGADNPKVIKGQLWSLDDDVTPDVIEDWQRELAANGWLARYESAEGKRIFQIRNFRKHQRPNKPTPSTLPAATDADFRESKERYRMATGGLPEESATSHAGLSQGEESRGGVSGCDEDSVSTEPEMSTTSTDSSGSAVASTDPKVRSAIAGARRKTKRGSVTPMFKNGAAS